MYTHTHVIYAHPAGSGLCRQRQLWVPCKLGVADKSEEAKEVKHEAEGEEAGFHGCAIYAYICMYVCMYVCMLSVYTCI